MNEGLFGLFHLILELASCHFQLFPFPEHLLLAHLVIVGRASAGVEALMEAMKPASRAEL